MHLDGGWGCQWECVSGLLHMLSDLLLWFCAFPAGNYSREMMGVMLFTSWMIMCHTWHIWFCIRVCVTIIAKHHPADFIRTLFHLSKKPHWPTLCTISSSSVLFTNTSSSLSSAQPCTTLLWHVWSTQLHHLHRSYLSLWLSFPPNLSVNVQNGLSPGNKGEVRRGEEKRGGLQQRNAGGLGEGGFKTFHCSQWAYSYFISFTFHYVCAHALSFIHARAHTCTLTFTTDAQPLQEFKTLNAALNGEGRPLHYSIK